MDRSEIPYITPPAELNLSNAYSSSIPPPKPPPASSEMSVPRAVPIRMEPSRWQPDFSHPFFRDDAWGRPNRDTHSANRDPFGAHVDPFSANRESFSSSRDPYSASRDPYRDPYREPERNSFRDLVPRDQFLREPAVYHPVGLPLTQSFFNPERNLSVMDAEMKRMATEMKRVFSEMQHLVPVDANPESWRTKENFLLDNPVVHDPSGKSMFKLQFDVRQFKPEEIQVDTANNQLTVHAKHEEKAEGKALKREYYRQYTLPKNVNPETLESKLTRDGVLSIEAPLPITDGGKERLIPIKHK